MYMYNCNVFYVCCRSAESDENFNLAVRRSFAGEGLERERFGEHAMASYHAGVGFAHAKANLESINRRALFLTSGTLAASLALRCLCMCGVPLIEGCTIQDNSIMCPLFSDLERSTSHAMCAASESDTRKRP